MKRIRIGFSEHFILLCVFVFSVSFPGLSCSNSNSWKGFKINGKNIVDPNGTNIILRGFDSGEWVNIEAYFIGWPDDNINYYGHTKIQNTLIDLMGQSNADEFYKRWEANILTRSDIQKMASWGANSIRLSINYHWLSPSRGVYLDTGWQKIDSLISWCKDYNIGVILAMHAAPGSQSNELMSDSDGEAKLWTEPKTYQPWTIDLWTAIAERYADETTVIGYDFFDEPILPETGGYTTANTLRPFYVKLTNSVRDVDSNHLLFIEGIQWAQTFEGLEPAWDKKIVWVFHKYWDDNDTASIQFALSIRDRTNLPIWNGETGENTNEWCHDMVELLESHNIGWNMWTYKKIYNAARDDEELGPTNPYSISEPANYDKILDYVKNNSNPKPTKSEATTIMLELADNTITEKCTLNSTLLTALNFKNKQ